MSPSTERNTSLIRVFFSRSINDPYFLMKWAIPNYVICIVTYMLAEGVSVRISWWFSVVTGFTVGYGDNFPKTLSGQLISAEFIITSWFVLAIVLVQIFTKHLLDRNQFSHEEQELMKGWLAELIVQCRLIYQLIERNHKAKMAKLDEIQASQQRQEAFLMLLADQMRLPYDGVPPSKQFPDFRRTLESYHPSRQGVQDPLD